MDIWNYPSRTLCAVLDEARQCCKTANYSYLPGLLEEIQVLGNRMEAALEDAGTLENMRNQRKELEKEIKKLRKEKEVLEG